MNFMSAVAEIINDKNITFNCVHFYYFQQIVW